VLLVCVEARQDLPQDRDRCVRGVDRGARLAGADRDAEGLEPVARAGTVADGVPGWVGDLHKPLLDAHESVRIVCWRFPPCRLRRRLGAGHGALVALAALLMPALTLR